MINWLSFIISRPDEMHPVFVQQIRDDMKVGLITATLNSGGAERTMVRLAGGLIRKGVDVTLYLVNKTGPYVAEIPEKAVVVDLKALRGVKSAMYKIRKTVAQAGLDALISTQPHTNTAVSLSTLGLKKKPRIILREANTPSADQTGFNRLEKWIWKQSYRFADHYTAVSEGVRRDMTAFYGLAGEDVTCIYNPVVDGSLAAKIREPAGHPWFNRTGPPVILAMGRIAPQKDFGTLLRAFQRVGPAGPKGIKLYILGDKGADPDYYQALRRLSMQLGVACDVEFAGFKSNPFAFLARASLFVLSSRHEGFPSSLVQALACGCPVVSTDCRSGPSEILDGGRYGRLVPVGDPEKLAGAILDSLSGEHDAGRLQKRADYFSVDRCADAYIDLIGSITGGTAP